MTLVIKTEMQKHCFYGNKLGHVDTECVCSAQLRGEQPSYLKGDNFFKFICTDCSEDGKESFERMRLTWQQVNTTTHFDTPRTTDKCHTTEENRIIRLINESIKKEEADWLYH